MINLFENFDKPSLDFLRSQLIAKIKIPSVAMNDDGFLPVEVDSPIKYFTRPNVNHQPLYFDEVPIPKYWRIVGNGSHAEVFDLDSKRAEIVYTANDNTRIVKEVQWLDSQGNTSWIDHYNQYGAYFAKTIYEQGRAVSKIYFNNQHQPIITHNLIAGDLFLDDQNTHRHFIDDVDFLIYFLKQRHYKLDHIFYNTLNKALAVSLRLPKTGTDTLFWHEPTGKSLPGNMKFLMENVTRTKHIIFQRYKDWQRKGDLIPAEQGNVDFNYLGMIYPHPRSNQLRSNALIITNSDQVEQLGTLAKLMPNVHISVAAVTEMSDKLMAFQDYSNIDLYPVVSRNKLQELMQTSDIYLDINQGAEILDAVRGAFEQNMLILGFKETLHHADLVNPDCVFEQQDSHGMAKQIVKALVQPSVMKDLIDTQRKLAGDVLASDYQHVIKELIK